MNNTVYGNSDGIRLGLADIVSAFSEKTIGTKVVDDFSFMELVIDAIEKFDWSSCRQDGQAYITLPKETCLFVSGGVGKRSKDPDDYVVRINRGEVGMYLKRFKTEWVPVAEVDSFDGKMHVCGGEKAASLAATVDNVAVVVYTLDAYLKDPDCSAEEKKRITDLECSHILVAVLASSGQPSTLTPHRFVHNLAGGNLEALSWTADEIRQKAREIKEYSSTWAVVAD